MSAEKCWTEAEADGRWCCFPDWGIRRMCLTTSRRNSRRVKGGKIRYVPMTAELASELRKVPATIGQEQLFPPQRAAKGERRRVESSFESLLTLAEVKDFRFHDLRHTFASWDMMNGGDLYELAKILGHSNIRMTERYAKLGKAHIARTGDTAREMWKLMSAVEEVHAATAV
jgi:integrase